MMIRKFLMCISAFVLICLGFYCNSQPTRDQRSADTETVIRAVADGVLKDATFQFVDQKSGKRFTSPEQAPSDAQLRPESAYTDWRYWNGVLNIAMIELGETLNEPAYIELARKNVAFGFDNYRYFEGKYKGEDKWSYPFGQHFIMKELDDCGAVGASVIEVHRRDQQERYRAYLDQTANHILTHQSRLDDGTLVRSFPHQWTLWADDLYMSLSFLSRMGEFTGEARYFDEAAQQVINFHQYLFDDQKGLMHHCWYSDVNRPGVAFWGRANGWAMVAQVDLLDRLPQNHPQRDTLLTLLRRHILGIAQYQSGEGLWHQLLDKVDSYLETSCSAMFIYTIARAVNKGYIEPRYASIAQRGWEGVRSKIRSDGQVEGVCTGTGVSDDLVFYYRRPTPINDVHGIGTILLAGAEVLSVITKPE
ncbi:glycosyl hydrolase [candidate division KSB1 bacterium]|nr:MAG: glycosyl hydrolase [candidate division KSB1 bacterium]MBC6946353.1 glycosyl hydrolase [candidate division KSB1 bacterium]MCE7940706.1 glycosyl hydrolase [Chlorobi bacterium CHB1]MDL1874085.1 glycosyl hydrolase [Cytophagia bacterium CHB2]